MKGGKRKGAGRPLNPNKKQKVGISLHPELIKRLDEEYNKNDTIEKALCSWFGITLGE